MKDDTTIVHAGRKPFDNHGIVNPPVYHASTVLFPTVESLEHAWETRDEPGTHHLRATRHTHDIRAAGCDGGIPKTPIIALPYPRAWPRSPCRCSPFLNPGDHILMPDAVYSPTRRFSDTLLTRIGVATTFYDPTIGGAVADLIQDNTRVIYLEAPGSQTFEMQDIPGDRQDCQGRRNYHDDGQHVGHALSISSR